MIDIKLWIKQNLISNNKLISKKCNQHWFEKSGFINEYNKIIDSTSKLIVPTFPQRIWHILNDIDMVRCGNPKCNNVPKFFTFTTGYLENCCNSCAQKNPKTSEKIKKTNLKKYGVEYGLSSSVVLKKRKKTLFEKYGVDNPTKSKVILDKIKKNNIKNYGVDWILRDQKKKEKAVYEKYGVKNIQQSKEIKEKKIKTRRNNFYDSLFDTDGLNNLAEPLFSKEEYVSGGLYINYKFKCNKCNSIFEDCLEDGDLPRCLNCFPKKGNSMFQKEVYNYIKELLPNEEVIENTKKIIPPLELDIYIPSKKLAIECDGLFWHGEKNGNKPKKYHLNKTIECEKNKIRLLHIFEDEWMNKSLVIKNKLKHILGIKSSEKIYARDCSVVILNKKQKRDFLNQTHIQGTCNSSIDIGLTHEQNLVAIMTFNHLRTCINNKKERDKDSYELVRYSTIVNVLGGAGKLLSHFIKTHKPKKIISYADRRWSNGKLYETLGFKKTSDGMPNYWYFKSDLKRHHRFGFAKHTLSKKLKKYDPNISEWQNMINNGWDRIWDCGSLRYEMLLK